MKICICGGGSLGIVCACVFLSQHHSVNILSGHPHKWNKRISVFDSENKLYAGELSIVTDDAQEAVEASDMVLLCVPGYLIEQTLSDIKPYLKKETVVGSIVSSTGFFFTAHEVLGKEFSLFGFQRVPFISRVRHYGSVGDLLGYKPSLNVAIENIEKPEQLRLKLQRLFMTPVKLLNSYYEASLTNSNPILHTGRLYSMWKDYNGEIYPTQSLFYRDWTNDASEILIAMDSEFMSLVKSLGIKDGVIPSLLQYYESSDAKSLTAKIKSIIAFKGILSPMKNINTGWIPDFSSRYFTEDFPFGLRFIKELAKKEHIPTPTIDKVYEWGISKINY